MTTAYPPLSETLGTPDPLSVIRIKNKTNELKSFEVNPIGKIIKSEIEKKYWFKIHHTSGPGFHTEFKFSIDSKSSELRNKKIELKVNNNIKLVFGETLPKSVEENLKELLEIPFEKGVQRFIKYLNENQINISTDLQIEILEYVFHAIDSKPIGNELGIEWVLKTVFRNQLNLEKPRSCQIEELK